MSEKVGLVAKKAESKGKDSALAKTKAGISPSVDINSPVEQILHLQRTIGNRAVSRMIRSGIIQAKLTIGQPGDIYEKEADRVADQVMRMTEPQGALVNSQLSLVQRQSTCPGCEEEETPISRKESGSCGGSDVMSCVESHINALKGGGQSLSPSTRNFFEPRFGSDFSKVRVHIGTDAAAIATEINAKAFTTGRDIFFNTGQYSPGTTSGKSLLAHELTHVVQQRSCNTISHELARTPQKGVGVPSPDIQCMNLASPSPRVCVCLFKFNVGKLEIDSSCIGNLALWIIPESSSDPAFTPAKSGTAYWADGFKIGSQVYKIDGSTCVTFSCSGSSVSTDTCVNNIAILRGKRAPYPVPTGTFSNEPPPGSTAKFVI